MDRQESPSRGLGPQRLASTALAVGASVLALLLLFALLDLDLSSLEDSLERASWPLVAIAAILSAAMHIAGSTDKLWRVLSAMGLSLEWRQVLRIRLGSGPLRILLPVDAGDLVNIVFLKRSENLSLDAASGAILFDRGLNLIGTTFWLLAGLALLKAESPAPRAALLAAIGLSYGLFLFSGPLQRLAMAGARRVHHRVGRFVEGTLAPFQRFSAGRKLFFCAYGVLFQTRPLIVAWLLFLSFGIRVPAGELVAWITLSMFAGHLPTAMGMGPREAALVFLFSGAAPPAVLLSIGILLTLLVHALPMAVGLPWVPWYLRAMARGTRA